jgi:MerR family Zn(II)-responsive transcriptional regulator of zntA
MQIGEAAKRTSLTPDAIRFYERRDLLPKAKRTEGRFRLHTQEDVERLHFIHQVQSLAFSLREIHQLLGLRDRRQEACPEVQELLKAKLATIRSKQRELASLERQLSADLRKCNAEMRHRRGHKARTCPILETDGKNAN